MTRLVKETDVYSKNDRKTKFNKKYNCKAAEVSSSLFQTGLLNISGLEQNALFSPGIQKLKR
jgi:hypothetical protein